MAYLRERHFFVEKLAFFKNLSNMTKNQAFRPTVRPSDQIEMELKRQSMPLIAWLKNQ